VKDLDSYRCRRLVPKKKIETPLLLKLTPLRSGDKRRYNIAIRDKHLFSFSQRVEKVKCNHEAPPILSI